MYVTRKASKLVSAILIIQENLAFFFFFLNITKISSNIPGISVMEIIFLTCFEKLKITYFNK